MGTITFKTRRSLLFLATLTLVLTANAQVIPEIMGKLDLYLQKYPEECVYVHTDRSVYSPEEISWFKAYILQDLGESETILSNFLFISLIDKDSLEVFSHALPIANNQVSGSIPIPKMITPGYYKLIAYTSWMQNMPADRIFSKEIFIEKHVKNAFSIDIKLKDTLYQPNSTITAMLSSIRDDRSPVSVSFNYQLVNNDVVIASGKGKTAKTGEAVIHLQLPAFTDNEVLKFKVDASYKGNTVSVGVVIPTPDNYLNVLFYPEGGMLLNGIETKIAFRAFNRADRPVDFTGEIYTSDHQLVQKTRSIYQGIGSFYLTPEKGQTYHLKITQPAGITKTFDLPAPRRAGVALHVNGRTADTLTLTFEQTSIYPHVYHFIGQMRGKVYWIESLKTSKNALLKVPLNEFPAGVVEFTAFDTAKNLLAKRLVFVNKDKHLNMELKTDKQQYAPREKVTLTLRVTDDEGRPVKANLSIAAVNEESVVVPDNSDFFSYATMKSDLIGHLPTPGYYFTQNQDAKTILDHLLIANAFKRFTWNTVLQVNKANLSFCSMEENGAPVSNITYDRHVAAYFAQDLTNSMMSPGKSFVIQTPNDMKLILNPDKPRASSRTDYSQMRDVEDIVFSVKPYKIVDNKIVFTSTPPNTLMYQQGAAIAVDGVYRGTDPSILNTLSVTDIDRVNISTSPTDVQKYTGLNSIGIIEIFTKSGNPSLRTKDTEKTEAESINLNQEFQSPYYAAETGKKSSADDRETLFWDPEVYTNQTGTATISFYNGDISSKVWITVEGKSDNGLVGSSTTSYQVIPR